MNQSNGGDDDTPLTEREQRAFAAILSGCMCGSLVLLCDSVSVLAGLALGVVVGLVVWKNTER